MMFGAAAAAVTPVRTIYVLAFCIVSNACYSRGTTTQIHAQNTIHFGPGPGPVQANQAGPNLKRRTAAYKSGVLHSAAIYHARAGQQWAPSVQQCGGRHTMGES